MPKNSDQKTGAGITVNDAAPRPRRLCESSPRLCCAMSVVRHPAPVVYWAGIGQIIKTFPGAIASRDHWQADAKSTFGSTSRGGQQGGGSTAGETAKVDEAL